MQVASLDVDLAGHASFVENITQHVKDRLGAVSTP